MFGALIVNQKRDMIMDAKANNQPALFLRLYFYKIKHIGNDTKGSSVII